MQVVDDMNIDNIVAIIFNIIADLDSGYVVNINVCKPYNINESNKVIIRYIVYMHRSWRSDRGYLVTGTQPPS